MKKGTKRKLESIKKHSESISGNNHWNYGKHRSEETKQKLRLANLGKKYDKSIGEKRALKLKGKKRTEEQRQKISNSHKGMKKPWAIPPPKQIGEKNFNWKGGINSKYKLLRASVKFDIWRNAIFTKDNYTCQKCYCYGGKLHAHHIYNLADNFDKGLDINNGITLCKSCHLLFHKINGVKLNTPEQLTKFMGLK